MAAVLGCSSSAVVAEWSAAAMLGLVSPLPKQRDVQILVRQGDCRRTDGVRARRCPDLHDDEIRQVDGVPVTSPARTLLDLASTVRPDRLEQLTAAAQRQGFADRTDVEAVLSRHPRHRGARALRVLVDDVAPPSFTRSKAEALLLAVVRSAHLPRPQTNIQLHGFEVDAYWRRQQLVVEVDGSAFHSSEASFHGDRRRDSVLAAAGVAVTRLTWRHLTRERDATIARLAATLVQREVAMNCKCGAAFVEPWE
jgi:very-short-patch-repair endonuclease